MRITAILLAAGEGRRMGGPKALIRIHEETFLARSVRLLSRPGVGSLVVVAGHQADLVVGALPTATPAGLDPTVVVNLNYRDGMLGSLLRGLDVAEAWGADAVLVHPVDHPLVDPGTVDAVVAALRDGAPIAVPSHGNRRGHPGGFARSVWPHLRAAPLDRGARAVLAEHSESIVHVPGDPGCLIGIDTPEDLARFLGA